MAISSAYAQTVQFKTILAATWFTSKEIPDILILWEYNLDNNQQKVWHIGFVWNRPEN